MSKDNKIHFRILFVDDDEFLLSSLKRSLYREDFEILCADSALDALNTLKKTNVDIVVSDQEMPGIKGIDFLEKVYKDHPGTLRCILTGFATTELAIAAINKGFINKFFTKPLNRVEFLASIKSSLKKKEILYQTWLKFKKMKNHKIQIQELEKKYPGLSKIHLDDHNCIVIQNSSYLENEDLIKDINEAFKFHVDQNEINATL